MSWYQIFFDKRSNCVIILLKVTSAIDAKLKATPQKIPTPQIVLSKPILELDFYSNIIFTAII
jgi:hypothetical protein